MQYITNDTVNIIMLQQAIGKHRCTAMKNSLGRRKYHSKKRKLDIHQLKRTYY